MRFKSVPSADLVGAITSLLSRHHLLASCSRFRRYHRNQSQTTADSSVPRASFDTSRRDRCHLRSVPPSPPLLSEERHRARGGITSPVPRGRATTTTTTASTTGSKRTCSPVRSAITRHRQVAPVDTRIARGKLLSGSGKNAGKSRNVQLAVSPTGGTNPRDFDFLFPGSRLSCWCHSTEPAGSRGKPL